MKLELSHIIALLSIVATLAGFYYTTNHRLDHLEEMVIELKERDALIEQKINKKQKRK
tara:strand:+ start:3269 stop:3442 length:174 start_codon:yes stop_codon:yes gene_type:complete